MKNSLKKGEILRGFSAFNDVIKNGDQFVIGNIKVFFIISQSSNNEYLKTGFTVVRGIRKKVFRNRIKRLLKEYFRINKINLYLSLLNSNKLLRMVLLFHNSNEDYVKKINLYEVSKDLSRIFENLIKKIEQSE